MLQVNEHQDSSNQNLPTINFAQNNEMMTPAPLNANAFMACNQGVANGFGAMFFNIRDPSFTQTNQPIKQEPSLHIVLAVVTVILVVCFAVAAAGFNKFISSGGCIALFVVSYVLYLILGLCCSDLRSYLHNMKRNAEY